MGSLRQPGKWRGTERKGKSSVRRRSKNGPRKWLSFKRNIVRPRRESLAIEREKTLQGQLRDLKASRAAELEKARGEIEAELSKQVEFIDRISVAKVKGIQE
jgi:hypothetical protein